MKATVMGTGYVGLTTGAMLAQFGHKITCIDIDERKIDQLNMGQVPFYEPGLDALVKKHLNKNLKFSTGLQSIVNSKVVICAVGTPPNQDGSPDMSYVLAVAQQLIPYLKRYKVIVIKSTVPVGTKKIIQDYLLSQGVHRSKFDIVSNPEFLREGTAIHDSFYPDRIVIGSDSQRAVSLTYSLYQQCECPVLITSNEGAEMIKYAANSFLATKISFINELADICEKYSVDIEEVARGIGYDKRIGLHFLKAGVGFGGSCLPKDLSGLIYLADKSGIDPKVLRSVSHINAERPYQVVNKLKNVLGSLENKKIAVWGLAFKPETDDMRFAPSIPIIKQLVEEKAKVYAFDPVAANNAKPLIPECVKISNDMYEIARDSDAVVIVTEWDLFKNADLSLLKKVMKYPVIIDGRNIFSPADMKLQGFNYYGTGR